MGLAPTSSYGRLAVGPLPFFRLSPRRLPVPYFYRATLIYYAFYSQNTHSYCTVLSPPKYNMYDILVQYKPMKPTGPLHSAWFGGAAVCSVCRYGAYFAYAARIGARQHDMVLTSGTTWLFDLFMRGCVQFHNAESS